MTKIRILTSILAVAMAMTMFGCSHTSAVQKQSAACQKIRDEAERSRCLQKVHDDESAYERIHNESKIEKDYKWKLDQMKPAK